MEGKKVSDTRATVSQIMTQLDANLAGNVHGGVIMKLIDSAAAVAAMRHCQANVVTASVDRIDFHSPVLVGDLVTLKASINLVGSTSMEVGVRVESENIKTREIRHTASAYLTLVAMKDGRPTPVPSLILETEEDKRRNAEAKVRREHRLRGRKR